MKKKIVLVTLFTALCVNLTACGTSADAVSESTSEASSEIVSEMVTSVPDTSSEITTEESTQTETTPALEIDTADANTDLAVVAQDIKDAVAGKDLEALSKLAIYPVYVGIGDGMEIASEDDFMKLNPDDVFTDEMVAAIASVNNAFLSQTNAGIILSGTENAKPNIILGVSDSNAYGITGINY